MREFESHRSHMLNRHKHNWNLIDKTENDSILDKMIKSGAEKISGANAQVMNERTVVYVFKCDCGKIRIETRTL